MQDNEVTAGLLSSPGRERKNTEAASCSSRTRSYSVLFFVFFFNPPQTAGGGRLLLQRVAERLQHGLHSGDGGLQSSGAGEWMPRRASDGGRRVTSTHSASTLSPPDPPPQKKTFPGAVEDRIPSFVCPQSAEEASHHGHQPAGAHPVGAPHHDGGPQPLHHQVPPFMSPRR